MKSACNPKTAMNHVVLQHMARSRVSFPQWLTFCAFSKVIPGKGLRQWVFQTPLDRSSHLLDRLKGNFDTNTLKRGSATCVEKYFLTCHRFATPWIIALHGWSSQSILVRHYSIHSQARRLDFAAGGPKTTRGAAFFKNNINVCSNRGAKHEMGAQISNGWPDTTGPCTGDSLVHSRSSVTHHHCCAFQLVYLQVWQSACN